MTAGDLETKVGPAPQDVPQDAPQELRRTVPCPFCRTRLLSGREALENHLEVCSKAPKTGETRGLNPSIPQAK